MNRRKFLKTFGIIGTELLLPKFSFASKNNIKQIYLTIDDGPRKYMQEIIKRLETNKVIFYVVGEQLENKTGFETICNALERGHLIGNHSYSHPQFSSLSISSGKKEIERTDKLIQKAYNEIGRTHKKFFRFPYGDSGYYYSEKSGAYGNKEKRNEFAKFLKEIGYTIQFWDIDTEDWKHYSKKNYKTIEQIIQNCSKAEQGHIVLTHEKPITLEKIIPCYIDSQEYTLILPN